MAPAPPVFSPADLLSNTRLPRGRRVLFPPRSPRRCFVFFPAGARLLVSLRGEFFLGALVSAGCFFLFLGGGFFDPPPPGGFFVFFFPWPPPQKCWRFFKPGLFSFIPPWRRVWAPPPPPHPNWVVLCFFSLGAEKKGRVFWPPKGAPPPKISSFPPRAPNFPGFSPGLCGPRSLGKGGALIVFFPERFGALRSIGRIAGSGPPFGFQVLGPLQAPRWIPGQGFFRKPVVGGSLDGIVAPVEGVLEELPFCPAIWARRTGAGVPPSCR